VRTAWDSPKYSILIREVRLDTNDSDYSCLVPAISFAQTDEIQVYGAEIAAPGVFNLTWHNNFTPSGPTVAAAPGGVVRNHSRNGVPEWAYGVRP
jgi:hypothetical protein